MKYVCLIYVEETKLDAIPAEAMNAIASESAALDAALRKSGRLFGAERLQPVASATTIRFRDGRPVIADGPFAETKEQLGGFWLIEAKDLDDAIRIASKIPPARLGCVEVRPVRGQPRMTMNP